MPILRGLAVVVFCGLGFGTAGGLFGLLLGVLAPAYYRGVFRAADDPRFNPIQVGLGLGLTQGLLCGVAVGCVVLLACGCSRRSGLRSPEPPAADSIRSLPRTITLVIGLVASLALGGAVGFVVGAVVGQVELYRHAADARLARVRPVLQGRRFTGVAAEPTSDGHVYLSGKIRSRQDYEALGEGIQNLFGVEEAREMMGDVEIVDE